MQKIYKAALRDIYFNKSRSAITFFALFVTISFPLAMFSVAPSLSNSVESNSDEFKLAHLDVRLSSGLPIVESIVSQTIKEQMGVYPEEIMSRLVLEEKTLINNEWHQITTVGVNISQIQTVNQVKLVKGKLVSNSNEIVLLDSYADYIGCSIGDTYSIYGQTGIYNLTIVGLVKSIEFLSYDLSQVGTVFVTETLLRQISNVPAPFTNSVVVYIYEGVTSNELQKITPPLREKLIEKGFPPILLWQVREVSIRGSLLDSIDLTAQYLNAAAVIIMIITGIVIYVITNRYAIEQRKQTGVFYAYGFNPRTIMKAFLMRTFVIDVFAMIFGVIGGWYLLNYLTGILAAKWGILTLYVSFSNIIVAEIVSLILLFSLTFTYLAAKTNVSMSPYEALRGKVKDATPMDLITEIVKIFPLSASYAIRNIFRNRLRTILTIIAFFGAISLSFSLLVAQSGVDETVNYYYEKQVKWESKGYFVNSNQTLSTYQIISQIDSIKYSEPYLETITQPVGRDEMVVYMRGLISDSEMLLIDLIKGEGLTDLNTNECVISRYAAEKLGLEIGDPISMWHKTTTVNFTITGICREMELISTVFVQIDDLETQLGYYPVNAILAKAKVGELNNLFEALNSNPVIQLAITKESYEERLGSIIQSQTLIVNIMTILGFTVSTITLFSTTLITVVEREREIALFRVFGFSKRQIISQMLIEVSLISFISILIGLIGGYYLNIFWLSIISEIFFKIDSYLLMKDVITVLI
ncbi:MAG: ABC transporter permease, partial [Candidatus Kariarchaeaceae archaeon]